MFRFSYNVVLRCALGVMALSLTACGGSQQSLPSPASQPIYTNKNAAFSKVTLVIKVPKRTAAVSATRRRPLFVSPSLVSVTVSVSAPGSPAASTTSNVVCSTSSPVVCAVTATILAPVQKQDTFTVTAYDGPNATGNELSQGSTVLPVNAGQAIQIPVVLQGSVASIVAVTVANANPLTGSSATSGVSVSAADADGNVIVGQYQTPVSLQLFENDPDGLFSFEQGGFIKTTATVASSATSAALYLKAKTDTTVPDDATLVATLANAPFVPGTSLYPPLTNLGEVTTACPATSPQCVFYPTGLNLVATQVAVNGGITSTLNSWNTPSVVAGTPQDPSGGTSIWNVPNVSGQQIVNRFDTLTDTFSNVSTTAPVTYGNVVHIGASFWAGYIDQNSNGSIENFTTDGTVTKTIALSGTVGVPSFFGSSFDTSGQLWLSDGTQVYAVNVATGGSSRCSFESTDINFATATISALEVAGGNVWISVTGGDQNAYVFKIPAAITATGCDLTTLETPANKFELTSQAGSNSAIQIVVDAAGDAYAITYSSVVKITPAGQASKLVDTGTTGAQYLAEGTVDPSGTLLYLVDLANGELYKVSATTATSGTLPSIVLPAVLGIVGAYYSYPYYSIFFTPDGSLWMGSAPFQNSALPFSLLGIGGGYSSGPEVAGGLDQIRLPRVTFVAHALTSHQNLEHILRNMRARQAMQRSRFRRSLKR